MIGPLHVPRLSTAFLDCFHRKLSRGQLTRLFLEYVETGTVAILLPEAPNLLHCRLHFKAATRWNVRILHLPRLATLVLEGEEILFRTDDVYNLLLTLRAPAPENIPLASVIKAFGCQLERLGIADTDSETSLEEYHDKAGLPEVAHLELRSTLSPEVWGHWDLSKLHGSGGS
ncbi:hypothetical protein C8F01DRAFT_1098983 [Mycena amicta]|nr:hypothetical protein C8F01DRAFT_1098983 [Mycena amicta]